MSFSLTARSGKRFSQTIAETTNGEQISRAGVYLLIAAQEEEKISELMRAASCLRDRAKGNTISFLKKVFIPLTNICRDRCRYCAFRKDPGEPGAKIMTPDEVIGIVEAGARLGCKEGKRDSKDDRIRTRYRFSILYAFDISSFAVDVLS